MRIDVQHRARPLWVVLGVWAAAAVAAVLPLSYDVGSRALLIVFVVFGGPALVAAAVGSPVLGARRGWTSGSLTRREDALDIESSNVRTSMPLAALDGAWQEGKDVVLSFRGRVIVRAEAWEKAEALLRELGFAPGGRAIRIPVGAPTAAIGRALYAPASILMALVGATLGFAAVLAAVGAASPGTAAVGLVLGAGAMVVSMLLARAVVGSSVVLGADGVWVRRGVASRYVAFADETKVRARGRKVFVGRKLLCHASRPAEANELVRQIALRRARAAAQADATLAQALARGGGGVGEWTEQVRRLAATASYRDQAVTDEALAGVLEDAREPPDRRAAAALALGARSRDTARDRVRVAAEACAHPKLRVSLEAAAEGQLDQDAIGAVERSLRR